MARLIPAWRRYLRFGRTDIAADISDELHFHFDERIEALTNSGLDPTAARAQALREFGDISTVRTHLIAIDQRMHNRRTSGERLMVIRNETRLAIRRLLRQPSFAIPAVLTLGLGLAATAVVFTLLNTILLRPMPYLDADRLVSLASPMPKLNDVWGLGRHQLAYYKQNVRALEDMALYRSTEVTIPGEGTVRAERISAAMVSASIFPTLRITPELGRALRPEENLQRGTTVVVLGYDYWLRHSGGNRNVIGTTLNIEGTPYQIVGVTAAGAALPDHQVDIWVPAYIDPTQPAQNNHVWNAVARLRPGFTARDAESQIAPLVLRMDELFPSAYPNHWVKESGFRTSVTPLRDDIVGPAVARALWILFTAVGLVLFVAVANVANLVLVRTEAQRREIVMRTALGASRGFLAVHYITEGLVVTLLAALLACGLTATTLGVLPALAADTLPRLTELHFDWITTTLIVGTAMVIGIIFGMIPLAHATPDAQALREGSRTLTSSRTRLALRHLLVVGQVAFTVVLLVGAGLLLKSGQRLRDVQPGFDPTGVITLDLALPSSSYRGYDRAATTYRELADRIKGIPGVQEVGFTESLPLSGDQGCTSVFAPAEGALPARDRCIATMQVSPGYFATMGIPIQGQAPDWGDAVRHKGGVVVSPSLARRFWSGQDPIGKAFRCCHGGNNWDRVVGVAGEVHGTSLDEPPNEVAYFAVVPPDSSPTNNVPLNVHMVIKAPTLAAATVQLLVRNAMAEIDPTVPVSDARQMTELVAASMSRRTFTLLLLGTAALMALVLSAVGLYGVIAYVVGQRQREIGVRIALGARSAQIGALVLGQSIRLVVVGVALGLIGAIAGTRVLQSFLFQVSPTDTAVLVAVPLLVIALGIAASSIPTARAVRIDPVVALRAE